MGDAFRRGDPENNSQPWYPPDSELGPSRTQVYSFMVVENALGEITGHVLVPWGLCWGTKPRH